MGRPKGQSYNYDSFDNKNASLKMKTVIIIGLTPTAPPDV
jgi:hypothetical protein